jgi:uncharacterized protein with FMN-binding domain
MKRFIASVIIVLAFAAYAIFSRGGSSTQTVADLGVNTSGSGSSSGSPTASGSYTDGTYTGSRVSALYGVVQVQAIIKGGRLTDVQVLSHPTGRHSDELNADATPLLVQEAVSTQSAKVQVVSGATLTSRAFMESLQVALDQA